MRMIGQLEGEAQARAFGDYLLAQGIENLVEAEKGNSWAVWIHEEEQLERARTLLSGFLENPADPKFKEAAGVADKVRERKKKEQAEYERRLKKRRHLFQPLTGYGFGPLTFVLIFVSCVIYYLDWKGVNPAAVIALHISDYDITGAGGLYWWAAAARRISAIKEGLPEIQHGEVWRLFTPIFLHANLMHILFNMLWLRDLGSMIEGRQNSLLLAVMVLAIAAVSNLAQYFVDGPAFGGMSGVVYGLFGYIWIRGKLDPGSGLYLNRSTVIMMIIWFFACLLGVISHVANAAHAGGLLMGMAWGYLSSLRYR